MLPAELLETVFQHISHPPTPSSQPTLHASTLVSRAWYSASIPFLYASPLLAGANFDAFVRAICPSINAHVRRNGLAELVRRLDMSALVHNGSKSLTARILGRMKGRLEVFVAPQASFAVNCLAALSKCSHLRKLDLQFVSESIAISDLLRSLSHLPRLETLHLPRSSGPSTHLATARATSPPPPSSWPRALHTLHITGGLRDGNSTHLLTLPPTITSLTLAHCPHLTMATITPLLTHLSPHLLHLSILAPIPSLSLSPKPLNNLFTLLPLPHLLHLRISLDLLTPLFFTSSSASPSACLALRRLDLDCHDAAECTGISLEQVWQGFEWAEGCDGKFRGVRVVGIAWRLGWVEGRGERRLVGEIDELLKAMAREDDGGVEGRVREEEAGVRMFGPRM
ncbi:hypothetical protein MMC21_008144 [Puttea exsequens]|nr:hypothetical protein [Puttea exsequens]